MASAVMFSSVSVMNLSCNSLVLTQGIVPFS